jgi:hypothetical protein
MVSYGSVARPVDLGPFSRIVEVHWGTVTHVALLWRPLGRSTTIFDTEFCSPAEYQDPFYGHSLPPPPHPWDNVYLSEVEYYAPTGSPQGVAQTFVFRNKSWQGPEETPVIVGLPALSSPFTHDPWQYEWHRIGSPTSETSTDGTTSHVEQDFAASFIPASGADIDIPTPNSLPFQTGFTPTFAFSARSYLSPDPVCIAGSSNNTMRFYDDTLNWIDTLPVPLGDIVVTYRDKTFRGMAARQIASADPPIDYGCWILCAREDVTS